MALATSPQEPELPKEARFEPKHTCAWHWSALPPQWAPLGPASRLVERGNIAISAPAVFPTVDSSSYAREVASRLLKLGTFVKSMQEPKGQEVRQQSKKRAVISPHSSPQEPPLGTRRATPFPCIVQISKMPPPNQERPIAKFIGPINQPGLHSSPAASALSSLLPVSHHNQRAWMAL